MKLNLKFVDPNGIDLAPRKSEDYYKFEVLPTKNGYNGLFTKEKIRAGSVLIKDGGQVVSSADDEAAKKYAVLISESRFLAPNNYSFMENSWFLNHSCFSNVARIGGLIYIAKRDIDAEEELTIDYAPLMSDILNWTMECRCGHSNCRKIITSYDYINPTIAKDLWIEWLPFIQKKILEQKIINNHLRA